MKIFSFLTKDNFRIDVKASNIKSAINKIKSIPYLVEKLIHNTTTNKECVTYLEYDRDGFASVYDWKTELI